MRKRLLTLLLIVPILLGVAALAGWIWLWHSEPGAQWAWQQARQAVASMPMGARLEGQLSGTLNGGLRITSAAFHGGSLRATAERIELAAYMNLFPAVVVVPRLVLHGVEFELEERTGEGDSDGPDMPADLGLPLPVVFKSLRIENFEYRRGDIQLPLDSISAEGRWFRRLQLDVTSVESAELSGTLELRAALTKPFPLESEIWIDRLKLPERAQSVAPWLPATLESGLAVSGDMDRLNVDGEVRWPGWIASASITGQIEQPLRGLRWEAELEVPETILPEALLGPLMQEDETAGLQRIVLLASSVRAEGGTTGFEFRGTSRVESPWAEAAPVDFEGAVDEDGLKYWSLTGHAEMAAEGWPAAQIEFTADGSEDTLSADVSAPSIFGGSLSLTVEAELGEQTPWQAGLTALNVSTAPLIEALAQQVDGESRTGLTELNERLQTETIDARVEASGQLDPLQFSAVIERLEGRVRGRPVVARGSLEYGGDGLSASDLVFESGRSRLTVDGSLGETAGIELAVDIATLDDILPGASGSLAGRVRYAHAGGNAAAPAILRINLQGKDLRAFEWSVGELRVSEPGGEDLIERLPAIAGVPSNPPLWLALEARDIAGPAGAIPSFEAILAGDGERQSLAVSAHFEGARVEAALAGKRSGEHWAGTLERFDVLPEGGSAWALREAAPLRWADGLTVESACLLAGEESTMCLDIEHRQDGSQTGRASLASVSPNLFVFITGRPLDFSQRLDGALDWTLAAGAKPSATADFTITAGTITNTAEGLELLRTEVGVLRFVLERGSLHSGALDLPFESGRIDVDLSVPDVMAGQHSTLQGRIRIEMDNLDVVESFVPDLVQTEGRLSLDVNVGGTLVDPRLDGLIDLRDGLMHVHAPGLRLSDIQVQGRLNPDNGIAVEGTFTAGEGQGEMHGSVDLSDPLGPTFDMRLTGESLTLIDVPDIRLRADTDVAANWDGSELQLSGRVHVPWARFAPRYVASDTVSESPDVVIVAGGEELAEQAQDDSAIRITGELVVSMGEDVVVDLDLAKATMKGEATFKWNGPPTPVAEGQYDLKGEVQAYGQTLEISRASIRFPNVPADNPHLDIRAERRIYGNSLVTEAGVLVTGTIKRPVIEPYTDPPTNADRARALLITGSDFDYEQGVGAVNVGTYIAPRLYLSYGVGVFEDGNVITARYDLRQNLGVKATSGQEDTGVDISYTIER